MFDFQSTAQRHLEKLQTSHQHELTGLQSRLQTQVDQHHRDVSGLQSQIQFQAQQIQTLEQERQHLAAPAVDPAVFKEVEQLRAEVAGLKDQVAAAQNSDKANASRVEDLEKQLATAASDLTTANKEKASLSEQVKTSESSSGDLRKELKKASEEVSRLSDENERLSEQLAAQVERPVAEGQESRQNGVEENGHDHGDGKETEKLVEKARQESEENWQKKMQVLSQEKDNM